MQPISSYVRSQGMACAVINAIVNPALAWLLNRQMAFVPVSGPDGIAVDTAVTCMVLSLLVSLFVTPAVRRARHAGQLGEIDAVSRESRVLSHLPRRAWLLGLLIGAGAAAVLAPLMLAAFHLLGSSGLSFAGFALLKALYTAALGFAVTRWVVLRHVLRDRAAV